MCLKSGQPWELNWYCRVVGLALALAPVSRSKIELFVILHNVYRSRLCRFYHFDAMSPHVFDARVPRDGYNNTLKDIIVKKKKIIKTMDITDY